MLTAYQELNYMTALKANAKLPILSGESAKKPDAMKKNILCCLAFWGLMGAIERQKDPVYFIEQYARPQMPLLLRTISSWRVAVSKNPKESHVVVYEKDVKSRSGLPINFPCYIKFGNKINSGVVQDPGVGNELS